MSTATLNRRPTIQRLESRAVPATFTVLNANDAGPDSLRQAVIQANATPGPDTIDFGPLFQSANTITLTTGAIAISESVAILSNSAANVTVNGNASDRIFSIDSLGAATVTLVGLTLTGGKTTALTAAGRGGAIRLVDESLVVINSVLTGNTAAAEGGAICAVGNGDVTIRDSQLTGNSSTGTGGFHTGSGGAVALSVPANLLIERSTLSGNTAARSGGAVYAYNSGRAEIVDSTLSGNTAAGVGGGAVYGYGTFELVVKNSTISGNKATSFAGAGGGIGLSFFDGSVSIQNSTVAFNEAGSGGGGLNQLSSGASGGKFTLQSSVVAGNVQAAFSTSTPYDFTFSNPTTLVATHSLIGVADAGNFTIANMDATTKTGTQATPLDAKLEPLAVTPGSSVAVHVPQQGSPVVDAGANPANLLYDQRGFGFPRVRGAAADIGAAELDSKIPSAIAAPADILLPGGTVTSFQVNFFDDVGVNVSKVPVVTVEGPNSFTATAVFKGITPGMNGKQELATYEFTPPGGSWDFTDNGDYTVSIAAGQLFDIDTPTPNSFPGGVVGQFRARVARNLVVTTAADAGAGSLRQAITDANALVNTADTITFDAQLVGPITLTTGELTVTEGVVIQGPGDGKLTVSGGKSSRILALNTTAAVSVTGLTLADGKVGTGPTVGSQADDGGAVFVTAGGNLTLDGVVLRDNLSLAEGGAVGVGAFGRLTVRNSWLSGNTASSGGAIYFYNGGSLRIESSTVSNNQTTGDGVSTGAGGGVHFFGNVVGGLEIVNSTVSGNTATGAGGGVALANFTGLLQVVNSTVAANKAVGNGGGVARTSGTGELLLQSSIVATNTGSNGADLSFNANVTVPGDANLVGVADAGNFQLTGNGNLTGTAAVPLNPMLEGLGQNGGLAPTHALMKGSPALDAGGNPRQLVFDQRGPGFPRSSGTATDIGAFELTVAQPPTATVKILDGVAVQRSNVTYLLVTFSEAVTLGVNPFLLERIGSAGSVSVTLDAGSTPTQAKLVWAGDPSFATPAGSLIDGNYKLTVIASQVTGPGGALDGDNDGTAGGNLVFAPNDFFRLFGDADGNRTVNFNDFLQFRSAFGSTGPNPPYNSIFDFDGNNQVNFNDFLQFRARFGTTLAP